jgi:indolepyruvate ferredoxin oxidoreductase
VLGKFDEPGGDGTGGEWSMPNPSQNWLLRAKADLTPAIIAKAIAKRLKKLGVDADITRAWTRAWPSSRRAKRALAELKVTPASARPGSAAAARTTPARACPRARAPWPASAATTWVWMDRSTSTFTQMGGEGVSWVGQAPFTKDKHIFANLGDGTYFHSGMLAIRQSIAAG